MRLKQFLIPIQVKVSFWLFAAFLAYTFSNRQPKFIVPWIVFIFLSLLVHEMGHALMAALFGRKPRISLFFMGGVTVYEGVSLPLFKQFLVTLAGPLATFGFMFVCYFFALSYPLFGQVAKLNAFWLILNLIPIIPLDGGQIARIILESIFGIKGEHHAYLVSTVLALLLGLICLSSTNFIIGILFLMMGFSSLESWKRTKNRTLSDRNPQLLKTFSKAKNALESKDVESAKKYLQKIIEEAKEGDIYRASVEQLAFLFYAEHHDYKEAYSRFLEIETTLSEELYPAFVSCCFEIGDYARVRLFGAKAFAFHATSEIALMNSIAAADEENRELAIKWAEEAVALGLLNIEEVINTTPAYQRLGEQFLNTLNSISKH